MSTNPNWLEMRLGDVPEHELEVVTDDRFRPDSQEPMVSRSVRLSVDAYEWLRAEATARGIASWSELLRVLVEDARRPTTEAVVPVSELERLIAQHRAA